MNFWFIYFNCVFLNYCISHSEILQKQECQLEQDAHSRFQVLYQWSHLNYTWVSVEHYQQAIHNQFYIPANNAPTSIKIFKNLMFLAVPRFRTGVPATLAYFDMNLYPNNGSPYFSPYPSWSANNNTSCSNLISVQSFEIDTKGILWVIDGVRTSNLTRCPTKIVLFDVNNDGNFIHAYTFPQEISQQDGGFLNDIVVDESDGGFAYITDNSVIDPGIIVYSRSKDHSWKLRDGSMFPEPHGSKFPVDDIVFEKAVPVDGIALSPKELNGDKTLYYCALTAFTLYSIPTSTIKNEKLVNTGNWRTSIRNIGQKISQSDGIIIDNKSNMYLTMLPLYGIAKWNINQPLWTSKVIDRNRRTMIWPDGFAFDQNGYLYVISNKVFNYIDPERKPQINEESQFRVLRLLTETQSYMYT